jgi:hemolysin D
VPTGRTKTIQPLETGIVSAIHVQDGDSVTAGQVLIELDRTVTQAERKHIAQELVASQLDVARLSALRDGFETGTVPRDLTTPAGASEADVARTRSSMRAQAGEQLAKLASINQQIEQKQAEQQSIIATIAKIDATLPLVEEQASVRRKAMEIQYGNRIAYLDAQVRLTEQRHELIVQRRHAVEVEAARKSIVAQRDETRAEYARGIANDLAEAEQKAAQLAADLIKAEWRMQDQVLRAPIDGTVQQLAIHTIGGVATPAQTLMVIVPADATIEIEAMVANKDIGFVADGNEAEVKVDTFNFTKYGLLHGKVTNISRDAIARDKAPNQNTNQQKPSDVASTSEPSGQELLYAAHIALDQTRMLIDGRMIDLESGMAVTAEIKTGQRRIIEYLLSPLLRYRQESLRER